MPLLSLVVPTLGRSAQLRRLLQSLALQTETRFEVIVVDQNEDDRLGPLCAESWLFPLRRLHRPGERGASRARNTGWRASRGAILLFPDDDCWYPPDFLTQGLRLLDARHADIVTGRSTDEAGRTINGRYAATAGRITRAGVWTRQIEWISVFRREVLTALGGYDETIGIGAATPWQAAEGPDLILRAIAAGQRCWYDPAFVACHDELPARHPDAALIAKARGYGRGMGHVLRRRGASPAILAYWAGRALAALAIAALYRDRPRMAYCKAVLLGRLEGYLARDGRATIQFS